MIQSWSPRAQAILNHFVSNLKKLIKKLFSPCFLRYLKNRVPTLAKKIVHYDTCALSSRLLQGVKLGPERSEGPITPCNGLLKTLVSYNIL